MRERDRHRLDRRLLEACAPEDAEAALHDLDEERERIAGESGRLRATLHYWVQLVAVCAWGLAGALARRARRPGSRRPGRIRPGTAARLAIRGLLRTPGTSVTAVATLAVGLAPAVVLLGVFFGSARTLPVPGGEEIVQVRLLDARARTAPPPEGVLPVLATVPGVLGIGAARGFDATVIHPSGPAFRVRAAAMSPSTFRLLAVDPVRGRLPDVDAADADAVLLGWDVWTEELGGSEDLLGTTVQVAGRRGTVIGIMPEDFGFPENQSAWTVLPPGDDLAGAELVARVDGAADADGVVVALERAVASLDPAPEVPGPYQARLRSWAGGRGEGGELWALGALGVLVLLLLLICAANVSTLLLVRAAERADTLAIHAALGAARLQVGLQLFGEALFLALLGGAVGLGVGGAALGWVEAHLSPHWGYYWMRMEVRPPVLAGVFGAVLAAAVLAGTLPSLRAMRTDLRSVLAGAGRSAGPGRRWTGRWFLAAQVTLSSVGLVAALVLGVGVLRSGELTARLPLDRTAVASVALEPASGDPLRTQRTAAALRDELAALPGVRSASASVGIPGFGTSSARLGRPGDESEDADARPRVFWIGADPHVFETYGLSLLQGRLFTAIDDGEAPPVAVVTRSFARRWLVPGPAVGARIRLEGIHDDAGWAQVVGVVEDYYPDAADVRPDRVFVPLAQLDPPTGIWLSASSAEPGTVVVGMREVVARVDPTAAVSRALTLRELMTWLFRMTRAMAAFGALGGVAGVLVAAIGLYGLVAFRVRRRLPEIGVRMALGAPSSRILREVLSDALVRLVPPVALGLGLAFLASPVLRMFAPGRDPRAAWVYAAAGLAMVAVGLAAALTPALRASRLAPQDVLRSE